MVQTGSSDVTSDELRKCSIDIEVFDYKDSLQADIENADLIIGHAGNKKQHLFMDDSNACFSYKRCRHCARSTTFAQASCHGY